MKRLTVSVDDDVYRKARVRAAELNTSVSAVLRDCLTEFALGDTDFARRKALQDRTLAQIRAFRGSTRSTREEVHNRVTNPFR